MKIENGNNLGAIPAAGASGAGGTEGRGQRVGGLGGDGANADSAELSGLAGKISEALGQDSANRAAKGEHLRALISSGEYNTDSAAVTRGIVDDALTHSAVAGGGS